VEETLFVDKMIIRTPISQLLQYFNEHYSIFLNSEGTKVWYQLYYSIMCVLDMNSISNVLQDPRQKNFNLRSPGKKELD